MRSGSTPSRLESSNFKGDVNWVSSGELKSKYLFETKEKIPSNILKDNHLKLFDINSVVIAIYGLEADGIRGTASILRKESTISQACMAFYPKSNITSEYFYYWYKKHGNRLGYKYSQGTKQQNLSSDILSELTIYYPDILEQNKITNFLSILDDRIDVQNRLLLDYKTQKRALINNLFFERKPVSFVSLDKILTERKEYSEKNKGIDHVTLCKDGIIPKTDKYDRDFLVTNADKNYKITKINDICYNPANLKFGVICLNKYGSGIFSPIYVTFEVIKYDPYFVSLFLTSEKFINYIRKYEQGTVYERMSVSPTDFLKGRMPIFEQQTIDKFTELIKTLDQQIILEENYLDKLKKQRAYFINNLII